VVGYVVNLVIIVGSAGIAMRYASDIGRYASDICNSLERVPAIQLVARIILLVAIITGAVWPVVADQMGPASHPWVHQRVQNDAAAAMENTDRTQQPVARGCRNTCRQKIDRKQDFCW
jgi:hypothetical protein